MRMGEVVHSNSDSTPRRRIALTSDAKMESRSVLPTRRKATPHRRGSLSMSMTGASDSSTVDFREPRPLSPMYSECPCAMMSRQASA